MSHTDPDDPRLERAHGEEPPVIDHQDETLNVRAIAIFGAGILIAAIIAYAAIGLLLVSLTEPDDDATSGGIGREVEATPEPPPAPRLQVDEQLDLEALRAEEDAILNGQPAWIDEEGGVLRIPIDRAMELLAERGLEARPQEEAEQVQEVEAPDWNSGQPVEEGE